MAKCERLLWTGGPNEDAKLERHCGFFLEGLEGITRVTRNQTVLTKEKRRHFRPFISRFILLQIPLLKENQFTNKSQTSVYSLRPVSAASLLFVGKSDLAECRTILGLHENFTNHFQGQHA